MSEYKFPTNQGELIEFLGDTNKIEAYVKIVPGLFKVSIKQLKELGYIVTHKRNALLVYTRAFIRQNKDHNIWSQS